MRRGLMPVVLAVALVVLALGWTATWYILAGNIEAAAERWLAREAAAGRMHQCGGRRIGGFPFRFEMTCRDLISSSGSGDNSITSRAAGLRAVVQIYQPRHVILEIEGPVEVASPRLRAPLLATFTLAQASYRGTPERMDNSDAAVDGLEVRLIDGSTEIWKARHAEFHARRTPQAPPGARDFDVAISAEEVEAPGAFAPIMVSLQSTLFALPQRWRGPADLFREWQSQGGRVAITALRGESGDVLLGADGELSLTQEGRLRGALRTDVVGFKTLAGWLSQDSSGTVGVVAGMGLALLGESVELEGRPAVRLKTAIRDGEIRLGPIPLGTVPPFFQ